MIIIGMVLALVLGFSPGTLPTDPDEFGTRVIQEVTNTLKRYFPVLTPSTEGTESGADLELVVVDFDAADISTTVLRNAPAVSATVAPSDMPVPVATTGPVTVHREAASAAGAAATPTDVAVSVVGVAFGAVIAPFWYLSAPIALPALYLLTGIGPPYTYDLYGAVKAFIFVPFSVGEGAAQFLFDRLGVSAAAAQPNDVLDSAASVELDNGDGSDVSTTADDEAEAPMVAARSPVSSAQLDNGEAAVQGAAAEVLDTSGNEDSGQAQSVDAEGPGTSSLGDDQTVAPLDVTRGSGPVRVGEKDNDTVGNDEKAADDIKRPSMKSSMRGSGLGKARDATGAAGSSDKAADKAKRPSASVAAPGRSTPETSENNGKATRG